MSKLTKEEKEKLIESIRRGEVDDDQLLKLKTKEVKTSNIALHRALKDGDVEIINANLHQVNETDHFGRRAIYYAQNTNDILLLLKANVDIDEYAMEAIVGFSYYEDELLTIIEHFIKNKINLLEYFGEDSEMFLDVLLETIDHNEHYYDSFLPRLALLFYEYNLDMEIVEDNLEHLSIALSTVRWMKTHQMKK